MRRGFFRQICKSVLTVQKDKRIRRWRLATERLEPRQLLAGDLIAHWTADAQVNLSGDNITGWDDVVGNRNATVIGSPALTTDAFNGRSAIQFDPADGTDDGFKIRAAGNPLVNADDFSIAVVFATDSNDLAGPSPDWFGNTGLVDANALGFSADWGVSIDANGQIATGMGAGFLQPAVSMVSTASGLNNGQLHLAVVTRAGSSMSIFVDDQAADIQGGFNTATRASLDMAIGMLNSGGGPFTGQIAQVRMYDGALSAEEVGTLHTEIDAYYSNSAPVSHDDQFSVNEDGFLFVAAGESVLANDTDPDSDVLTAVLIDDVSHGELVLNADGSFIYSPESDYHGTDSFAYAAKDFRNGNTVTATIDIASVYDSPRPLNDAFQTVPLGTLEIPALTGVLANDRNVDNAPMKAVVEQDVTSGTLALNEDGSFSYAPEGFSGIATFTYQIDDGISLSNPATVSITVNTAPEPVNDDYRIDEDRILVVPANLGILSNDIDADGNALTITLETETTNGELQLQPDGSFQYTPSADFFGRDQFTYSVNDSVDSGGPVTVSIDVDAVNDPPISTADAYVVSGLQLSIGANNGVLANDTDIDSAELTAELIDGPTGGTLELQSDGSFTYVPETGFSGNDKFSYRASDGEIPTEPTDVIIVVQQSTTNIANPTGDSVVTFNEFMYHPVRSQVRGEWLELHNQMGINMDISGWRLTDGIYFEFPEGTVIPGNGYLVIASNPEALLEDTGFEGALGPFSGRLSNAGESIILRNNSDRVMDIINYDDQNEWPVAPDGSGSTLAKAELYTATEHAANWKSSIQVGGTPGAENFGEIDFTPMPTVLFDWAATASYDDSGIDLGEAWRQPDFDDAAWQTGPGIFVGGNPEFPPPNPGGPAEPGEGLVGYWPLDETEGDITNNVVEGGEDGVLFNTPRWRDDDVRGRVIEFNGTNEYVVAGTIPAIGVNDDFTWSLWFNQDRVRDQNGVILGNLSGGQQDPLQFITFTPNNFQYHSAEAAPSIPFVIADGEWWHLAVTKSGPLLTYYVNGEVIGSGETTSDIASNPLFIGGDVEADQFADGRIDDVAIWTRALLPESIAGLADGTYTPLTAPTVFKEGPLIPEDLPDDRTQISADTNVHYFRHDFTFDNAPDRTELQLHGLIDDGVVVYLNGQEIYRHNMPEGPVTLDTRANENVTAIGSTVVSLPSSGLVRGDNTLSVQLHQSAAGAGDAMYAAKLVALVTAFDTDSVALPILNEISAASREDFQVELFNPTNEIIDLTTFKINDYRFESGTLEPGGYAIVDQTHLPRISDGDPLFLISTVGPLVADAQKVTNRLVGRDGNEEGRWFHPTEPTFGTANSFTVSQDIVINELMYHAPGIYSAELDRLFENGEEWIELYNRNATETIDISGWMLADGVDYVIPDGVVIPPNSYVVISDNPQQLLRSRPGLDAANVIGPFDRNLSNGGENVQLLDQHGNLADEVHYYDGGRWPSIADARGSSLELRDPMSDNSIAEAWAGSDESHQTAWQTITIRGPGTNKNGAPQTYNELLLGLLDDGVVLIDDVTVTEHPDTPEARQLIQNGTFEDDAVGSQPEKWRTIGTQQGTVVSDPDDPNNRVLMIDASGPTEHMHNNAGTTLKFGEEFVRLNNNSEYEISLRARYVNGSNQLNSRLYFNRLGTTTRLNSPINVGTPGAENSQRVENAGPTFDGMIHSPAVPEPDQPITVTVAASDPQGIDSITLRYAVDGGDFQDAAMELTGAGQYAGIIPGQASGSLVQFYLEGKDTSGATQMSPVAGPDSRALIRIQDGQAAKGPRHTLRIVMTDDETELLHRSTNVMSNDRIGATVIYRESEIFYDAGIRLKGSQRGRDKVVRAGFNISFGPDNLFRDIHSTIGVDRSGSGDEYSQEEIIVRQIINHAGSGPQIYDDLIHVIAPDSRHTGSSMLNLARYNDTFLDSQYINGSAGTAFEYELIYFPTSTVDRNDPESLKRPNPDSVVGVPLRDLDAGGDDKEQYRWHWIIENNRLEDDYSSMINMLKTIGRRDSEAGFQEAVAEVVDVDQWLRAFAVTTLTGIGDNYTGGSQHNGIIYIRPSDNRALYLPWDMDFSFTQAPTGQLVTNGELRKFLKDPGHEHAYYGHVLDIVTTTVNAEYMNPWIDHFDELVPAQGHFQGFKIWIDRRHSSALDRIRSAVDEVPFEITTAGPLDVGDATTATIEGTGWVDVREIRLAGSEIPLNIDWITNNQWQVTAFIDSSITEVLLEAYNLQDELIGTQTIGVMTTGTSALHDSLRVTEINYNPADPGPGELFVDNDEYEFIELRNVGESPIDLEGVGFVQVERRGEQDGIRFAFASQIMEPNETLLVVRNPDAFISRYGSGHNFALGQGDAGRFDVFSGQIANGGETLTLLGPNNGVIQQFTYDDAWYDRTDGNGLTLEFIDPSLPDLSAWNDDENWQPSGPQNGTPGAPPAILGDANRDGVFNQADLILVFQAGEYEDGIDNNSTFTEGDWNSDGDFNSRDIVDAFIAGTFVNAATRRSARSQSLTAAAVDSIFENEETGSRGTSVSVPTEAIEDPLRL